MNKIKNIILIGLTTLIGNAYSAEWATNRLLVMPQVGITSLEVNEIVKEHGGKARRVGGSDLHIVDLSGNASETAIMAKLEHNPKFKFVELDYKVRPDLISNDPYAGSQWHLPVLKTSLAWDTTQGEGVTIAIVDTGVLPTHPDLKNNLVHGWNAYDGNTITNDVHGHGTAVAGVSSAITNNGIGVSGIAGASKIMPIRVADSSGYAYYSTIASGITYAADNGVRVVNCSFGSLFKSSSIQSVGNYLKNKGGLLVISAGNAGVNENAVATSSMIIVSATDSNDSITGWSSYGDMVSVSAPGLGIWTTNSNGSYSSSSGTSFSAPITAGIIALIMSTNPSLDAFQVEKILFSTALDLGSPGKDIYFGHGRINAQAAVNAAKTETPEPIIYDTTPPVVNIVNPINGSKVGKVVQISTSASDNNSPITQSLYIDNKLVSTVTGTSLSYSWNTRKVASGMHTIQVIAKDPSRNISSSQITVSK
jgi:subtilisin family serine protease